MFRSGFAPCVINFCLVSGGATGLGPVGMADFENIEVMLQQGLLSTNVSEQAFEEIAGKAEQGFDVTIADIFGIVSRNPYLSLSNCLTSRLFQALNYFPMKDPSNDSVDPFGRLWSDITSFSNFSSGLSPMAVLMYNEVIPKGLPGHNEFEKVWIPADNARTEGTIYEASPFEVCSRGSDSAALTLNVHRSQSLAAGKVVALRLSRRNSLALILPMASPSITPV